MSNNHILAIRNDGRIEEVNGFPKIDIQFFGSNSLVKIHESVKIKRKLIIQLGENGLVQINKNTKIKNMNIWALEKGSRFICGGGCDLREVSVYYAGEENISVSIGNNCLISTGVHIRASDGHTIYSAINPKEILNASSKCIKIGNHVWVGQNALITKDVIIPNNCVVGMGAVVTRKNFLENSVIAGNPAKIVKTNINWDAQSIHEFERRVRN